MEVQEEDIIAFIRRKFPQHKNVRFIILNAWEVGFESNFIDLYELKEIQNAVNKFYGIKEFQGEYKSYAKVFAQNAEQAKSLIKHERKCPQFLDKIYEIKS